MIPYEFDAERFSRWMAYVLRHNPGRYGLQHDRHGFVDLAAFEQIARRRYPHLEAQALRDLIAQATGRFELLENRVRARYGHSIPVDPAGTPVAPPALLYYGIDASQLAGVQQEGLRPVERRMLHLSATAEEAQAVAARKAPHPVLLRIQAQAAHEAGVPFYAEGALYLTSHVPTTFIAPDPAP